VVVIDDLVVPTVGMAAALGRADVPLVIVDAPRPGFRACRRCNERSYRPRSGAENAVEEAQPISRGLCSLTSSRSFLLPRD
jgi:hypothetical protein